MKNTIILFFIMTAYLFSQGWNNTVTTTINEPNLVKMDLFTNKDGNHIIVQNLNTTNSIKYYLVNSSGTVVRSSTIETSGYAEFPNISGDNDKVYLVYKLGSNLKANYTTNAGQSWNSVSPKAIGSNTCNGVDIVYDYQGLHVVYAMKDSDPDYETYYYKLNSSNSWVDYKNVTDYDANEVGGFPTVTVSESRVHVSYNTGDQSEPVVNGGSAKSRDKYNTSWQTPQLIFSTESSLERIHAGQSKLFDFYYKWESGYSAYLYVKERSFSNTTWSSPVLLHTFMGLNSVVTAANTADGKTHIVYEIQSGVGYRSYNGSWSSESAIGDWYISPNISSTSNDLFIVCGSDDYIRYRQYDAAPLAPQNLTASVNNGHPKLDWSANRG